MKMVFIGAAHEVTGSCTLLEINSRYYLVDCGMEQGIDIFQNIEIPVPINQIEAVFLTHAHIDHSGMLPRLYKLGFSGSIYSTDVTADLCNIMLRDSAHIQETEAQWQTRKAQRAGFEPIEPAYTVQDAINTISLFRRCFYDEIIKVGEGVEIRFTDIGHLLGSACIEIWMQEGETRQKIVFSGDVGNQNQRIIRNPQFVEETDYLVIESTYGNRSHQISEIDPVVQLARYIQMTLDRGGNVVIPAFAVGRTQEILYAIREIKQNNMVTGHGNFPVYVDSPLAIEATAIFMQCNTACFDEEALSLINQGINPITFDGLKISLSSEESKAINFDNTPKVIISASGMCEAGRIRHHLKHNLWEKKNLILFVSYQAENSLGRRLQEGVETVKLFGEEISVEAEIQSIAGTSGHADREGLIRWLEGFKVKPKTVFVNHGENSACEDFTKLLIEKGYNATAPYSGCEYDLANDRMTVFAQGKETDKSKSFKGVTRADKIYFELVAQAEKLLELVKTRKGRANKDNAKLTSQIRDLIGKWKE